MHLGDLDLERESIPSSFVYSFSHCCLKYLTKSSLEKQAFGFGLQSVVAGMWWQEHEQLVTWSSWSHGAAGHMGQLVTWGSWLHCICSQVSKRFKLDPSPLNSALPHSV